MTSQLFGPDLWDKLANNPETASLLEDPSFKTLLDDLKADPSSLGTHLADPRILKLFTALSKQSAPSNPAAETIITDLPTDQPNNPTQAARAAPDAAMTPPPTDLPQPPKEQALLEKQRGTAAYKARDFPAAIAAYSAALHLDPDNMSFLTNRAAAKLEGGDVDGCVADCKQAISDNAERQLRTDFKIIARAYSRMGNAYLRNEDYDNAIAAFQKSVLEVSDAKVSSALREAERVREKKMADAYFDPEISKQVRAEGNKLFLAGQFPESITKYTDAIKRNPKDAAPYSNRAAAYMKLGEFPMAMKDCDRCLENDPDFVKAYIRKGNIHFFMKEFHKCLTVYEKGLKLAPNNKELRSGLMKTQMKIQEQQSSGEVDQAQVEQAMQDPEIQQILSDPQMNTLLKQMQEDPKFAAQAMQDPSVSAKIQKLVASGFLRVGS